MWHCPTCEINGGLVYSEDVSEYLGEYLGEDVGEDLYEVKIYLKI